MSTCETTYFGILEYDTSSIVEFPEGLPGFEHLRKFVLIDRSDLKPLAFMQSLEAREVCFLTVPAPAIVPGYQVELTEEQRILDVPRRPAIGSDVQCLVIVTLRESGPTVNLLAPVVIDLKTLRAVQAVMPESDYSYQHPLGEPVETRAAQMACAGRQAEN